LFQISERLPSKLGILARSVAIRLKKRWVSLALYPSYR
jgi:hypothetical protein